MIRPGAGWCRQKNTLIHLLKAGILSAHEQGKLSTCVYVCVCSCLSPRERCVWSYINTCVCHCHVFTQCYELQPWHCFHTPDMLLLPLSSAHGMHHHCHPPGSLSTRSCELSVCVCSQIIQLILLLLHFSNDKLFSHAVKETLPKKFKELQLPTQCDFLVFDLDKASIGWFLCTTTHVMTKIRSQHHG